MTEPDVAASDATNIKTRIRLYGNEYVINAANGEPRALDPFFQVLIVMRQPDPATWTGTGGNR